MVKEIKYIISKETKPYPNMALEEYLLHNVKPGECILYLWQNEKSVIIGRNQNAYTEVRVEALQDDGGFLARRLSGGGAVYHDIGNLNFTFLVRKEDYDLSKQCMVIKEMAQGFGLEASLTGRNDILVDGRKFSGNAYYTWGDCCYHHGTIMIEVDTNALSKYLNVSREKMESKGVTSVVSRVVNLKSLNRDIDVQGVTKGMIEAFEKVYGLKATEYAPGETLDVREYEKKFSSPEWKFGEKRPFDFSLKDRFSWGGIEILLRVKSGLMEVADVNSDAMDSLLISSLPNVLTGVEYKRASVEKALNEIRTEENKEILEDLLTLF